MSILDPIQYGVTEAMAEALEAALRAHHNDMSPHLMAKCMKAVQDYDRAKRARMGMKPRTDYPPLPVPLGD